MCNSQCSYHQFTSCHASHNSSHSAILSDVTTPANRSKALAHVGIAFAICFCIGPPIGAYFASRPLPHSMDSWGPELNIYAAPAILTLVLLVAETIFLMIFLPETRGKSYTLKSNKVKERPTVNGTNHTNGNGAVHTNGNGNALVNGNESNGAKGNGSAPKATLKPSHKYSVEHRIQTLQTLRRLHFLFLGIFSGMEFTLTFLTFDCQ